MVKRTVVVGFLLLWLGVVMSGCSGFLTKGYVTNKYYTPGHYSLVAISHSSCMKIGSSTSCTTSYTYIPVYVQPRFTLYLSSCYPPADSCDTGSVDVDGSTFDATPLGQYVDYSNR